MYGMKVIKGVLLFGILGLMGSCFDPPGFGMVPEIDFENIYFRGAKGVGERDSLVLTISFRDGNGDLGLSSSQIDPPFHDLDYYLANNGAITPLEKKTVYSNLPQFVDVPNGAVGKLVSVRTSKDPQYATVVPPYQDSFSSCTDYTYTSIYVNESDIGIFDDTYNIDTVLSVQGLPKVYVLLDTFYYQRNPNHVNIEVEFWVKESNGYTLFDWEKEFCTISFNQRFPVLTEKTGPLEGDLQYAIVTSGIQSLFSVKTMKLRIKIRDRALNASNVIETPEFTLDKIKR
jgi:hypothetical protein